MGDDSQMKNDNHNSDTAGFLVVTVDMPTITHFA